MTRIFDIFFSFVGIIFLLPILTFLFIVCYIDSRSPIYKQTRVGREMVPFTIFKFRTMYKNTNSVPTHLINPNSITRAGKIIRKLKLDELPQLFNVLNGDMSLVGPRPCLFVQEELIQERLSRGVFHVRPGITGLSQINGIDMSTPSQLAMEDEKMIINCNIMNYFKYILITLIGKRKKLD